nr:DUF6502 family protein [Pelagimonas varians]
MLETFDSLLAALARLMVARGVPFFELSERLKGHYVRAAQVQSADKTTDSRLSVMTGLQRRDIARLRAFEAKPARKNPLSKLVAMWQTHAEYCIERGPKPLPRNGPAPSFESLARNVRQDVHPRTMLDTLEAAGTVSIGEDGHITLQQKAYVPLRGSDEQLTYLSDNTGDHVLAACENVQGARPAHFERAVHYTGLTPSQVATLAADFEVGQMAVLADINAKANAMKSKAPDRADQRFRAGAYFYTSKDNPS